MTVDEAQARAERAFKQQERDRDGKTAIAEYQANAVAVRKNMARLKALRLAQETQASQPAASRETDRRKSTRK